jgi:hypothetical protein
VFVIIKVMHQNMLSVIVTCDEIDQVNSEDQHRENDTVSHDRSAPTLAVLVGFSSSQR